MYNMAYQAGTRHGTVDFPVAYYYIDAYHSRYNMPFHWHQEWEIIRILQGHMTLFINEEEYHMNAGDVILIRNDMLHGGTPKDCIYECLTFDLQSLFQNINSVKKYLHLIYRGLLLPNISYLNRQEDIYPIIDELFKVFSSDSGVQEFIVLGNLSRLFGVILHKKYYTQSNIGYNGSSKKVTQIKNVLQYIEAHYSSSLTLQDLSDVVGMSAKYFCRFFHSIIQQTPMDYVNHYRIEEAARMLCSTDWTITAVGLECGFQDSSYFVKIFKKYKGTTPKQYRKTII